MAYALHAACDKLTIEVAFDYAYEPFKCRIDRFVITLVTAITMPQWMDAAKAPAALQNRWPNVVRKIRTNEDGHKAK